jgi:hypothetical protein
MVRAELEGQTKWINIKDELPEENRIVMISHGTHLSCGWRDRAGLFYRRSDGRLEPGITHWTPLKETTTIAWTRVRDELPKIGERFLGTHIDEDTVDHYKRMAENKYFNLNWGNYEREDFIGGVITHWALEPRRPKDEYHKEGAA